VDILLAVRSKNDNSVQNVKYPVTGRLLLGRSPDSVVPLDGPGISREHLAIELEDSTVFITDLSSNGTWVNGDRLTRNRRRKVDATDVIELPGYEVRCRLVAKPEANVTAGEATTSPFALHAIGSANAITDSQPPLSLFRSFTALERLLIIVALASFTVCLIYLVS